MAGEVASLLLSRITVPVLYHLLGSRHAAAITLASDGDNALVTTTSG